MPRFASVAALVVAMSAEVVANIIGSCEWSHSGAELQSRASSSGLWRGRAIGPRAS